MKTWILRLFGLLGPYLSVLVVDKVKEGLELVLPIAVKYVTMAAADHSLVTSEVKRDAALKNILGELKAVGKTISGSLLNLALELAVQNIKSKS